MADPKEAALALVRDALTRYIDTPPQGIQPDTRLVDLSVDSLTLAELLFELEDKVGKPISDIPNPPQRIADVVDWLAPEVDN